MKNVLSPRVMKIANEMAKIPFVKSIFKPLYYPYKKVLNNKRRQAFLKNGTRLIEDFACCCDDNGFEYMLAFGTLLGAIREKGFIKHDCDIDVFMWSDRYSPIIRKSLEERGFVFEHAFLVEDGTLGREETYQKYNVSIDIFYIYPAISDYQYCCDFSAMYDAVTWRDSQQKYGRVKARRIEIPISRERILVPFESVSLYVPKNYHEFLSFRYGEDYMIPNPGWTNGANPHIVDWDEVKAIFIEK